MKIEQALIAHIRTAFQNMQSKEDLLQLMNEVKPIIYGEKTVPFAMKQLTWYSNPKLAKKRYSLFTIKKKSGAERTIHAPVKGLKAIQKTLSFILQCVYEPHKAATGFVREKSIVDNAKEHVGSKYVYNIDLKDFFPSVDQARVWKCLQLQPFNLNNQNTEIEEKVISKVFSFDEIKQELNFTHARIINTYKGVFLHLIKNVENRETYISVKIDNTISLIGETLDEKVNDVKTNYVVYAYVTDNGTYFKLLHNKDIKNKDRKITKSRQQIASIIASLCCNEMEVERMDSFGKWIHEKRNVLPQGAPTSPILTNVVCQRLDYLLSAVAKRFGLKYSRYADDITFSSMHNVYQSESDFIKELHRIIAGQGFHIKDTKTRLQKEGYRKEVTGLLVNENVNVQKRYIKQLRMWLYYWETYGYERAQNYFVQQYITEKGKSVKGKPDMINVIDGKLNYLKMVKGADNELYKKFKARFEKITGKYTTVSKSSKEIINEVSTNVRTIEKLIPEFHKPRELVALLKRFSINDSALKYTTHSWDAGRDANRFNDLSEFLLVSKSEFNKFGNTLKGLNEYLYWKIYNFLFNADIAKTGWGDINPKKRIYFGWSSPELLAACNKDISLNPEDFILPEKFQIQRSGKTLQKFKHIIDVFKNEIEVRDENSALLNLILQKHDNYLISFSAPKVSNLENKTFYTDIQWLSKALDLIFEGIQKYPQHPNVEYSVTENNNEKLVLTILHCNSFKNGLSINDDKLNLKRGDFSTIRDKLRNLCDWSIESKFIEGAYRINYLVSDEEIPSHEKIISAEGFKHILTFYK